MIEYFTGRYLMQSGLITKDKLNMLLTWLKNVDSSGKPLNTDDHNILKDNHIAFIQMIQNTVDEKLGDFASEYDGLTDEQMKIMVRKQQSLNTVFFNYLVIEGIVELDHLSGELEKMRNYYALNQPGISRNLKDDFDSILGRFVNASDYYTNEYAMIVMKYILRFVGTRIKFLDSKSIKNYSAERIALQKVVTTEGRYFIGLCGEKLVLQRFNDAIENIFKPMRRDTRYGSLCSFLNCISNIFQCLIAREREVTLVDMANVYKFSTIIINEKCHILPMVVEDMRLDLIIGCGNKPNFATITHNI